MYKTVIMILTRYLYPKHNVIYSLYVSLALSDLKQSLFWAYELYFSGFRTETVELLSKIWEEYYMSNRRFQSWLSKIVEKWTQNMQPEIVATIIENMIRREPDFVKFREKIPNLVGVVANDQTYITTNIYMIVKTTPPEYETKLAEYNGGWKLPKMVCQYISYYDPTTPPIQIHDYIENWLY